MYYQSARHSPAIQLIAISFRKNRYMYSNNENTNKQGHRRRPFGTETFVRLWWQYLAYLLVETASGRKEKDNGCNSLSFNSLSHFFGPNFFLSHVNLKGSCFIFHCLSSFIISFFFFVLSPRWSSCMQVIGSKYTHRLHKSEAARKPSISGKVPPVHDAHVPTGEINQVPSLNQFSALKIFHG